MPINAVVEGNNADLIYEVCQLYLPCGGTVADVTYGMGAFWRRKPENVIVVPSDIETVKHACYDFRKLPYDRNAFDVVVLDPPYIHNPGKPITGDRYNSKSTDKLYHADIRRLYVDGMREAFRCVKPGGQVWVKCKDQIESGLQRWSHCELLADALSLGMFGRDLFILLPSSRTTDNRWKRQFHARKPHSYLWIFERPNKNAAELQRAKVWSALNGKG